MRTMERETFEDIPAIAAIEPSGVSKKYSFIPTTKVINDLQTLGWYPAVFKGSNTSTTARHLIRFRQADSMTNMQKVGDECPELVLLNSHNGLSSFQMKAGVFRLACANGLVVAESLFKTLRIKHINYSLERVSDSVAQFAGGLPRIMDSVLEMKRIFLNESQIRYMIAGAISIRFDNQPNEDIRIASAYSPMRNADGDKSIWTVMNVIQERILKGYLRTNRGKRVRAITGTNKVVDFNQQLFSLAMSYVKN